MGERERFEGWWSDPETNRYLTDLPKEQAWWIWQRAVENHAERLEAENAKLTKWNQEMVAKAASGGTLDGYRELAQQVASAETRIAELEAREWEWQPIETAPRDGSEMLGWSSISGEAYVMWWEAIHSDWVWCSNDLEDMFCDPTHWMPLPGPPKLNAAAKIDAQQQENIDE